MDAAQIIREAARAQDPVGFLREAGWSLIPPPPPSPKVTPEGWYRFRVHEVAHAKHGWNGGSDPEPLLTDEERKVAWDWAVKATGGKDG